MAGLWGFHYGSNLFEATDAKSAVWEASCDLCLGYLVSGRNSEGNGFFPKSMPMAVLIRVHPRQSSLDLGPWMRSTLRLA